MLFSKFILLFTLVLFSNKDIPPINQQVVSYVNSVIGQKVDRGECWDLASGALNYAGAYLDRSSQKTIYVFGEIINPKKEAIYPGDIIQFENVKIEYVKDDGIYTETMPHHTAIIYEVLGKDHYKIAHQNTSFSGRKVGLSELKMDFVKKGDIIFYRPFTK